MATKIPFLRAVQLFPGALERLVVDLEVSALELAHSDFLVDNRGLLVWTSDDRGPLEWRLKQGIAGGGWYNLNDFPYSSSNEPSSDHLE